MSSKKQQKKKSSLEEQSTHDDVLTDTEFRISHRFCSVVCQYKTCQETIHKEGATFAHKFSESYEPTQYEYSGFGDEPIFRPPNFFCCDVHKEHALCSSCGNLKHVDRHDDIGLCITCETGTPTMTCYNPCCNVQIGVSEGARFCSQKCFDSIRCENGLCRRYKVIEKCDTQRGYCAICQSNVDDCMCITCGSDYVFGGRLECYSCTVRKH